MTQNNTGLSKALSGGSYGELSGRSKWEAKHETSAMVKRTVVSAMHEQGRAVLTSIALENVGALSALEQHLCDVAPSGAERYRHIVDAYALGAANKIGRW